MNSGTLYLSETNHVQKWSKEELDELYKFAYDSILKGDKRFEFFFFYDKDDTDTYEKFRNENSAGIDEENMFITPHSTKDIFLTSCEYASLVKDISSKIPRKLFISYYNCFKRYALDGKTYTVNKTYPDFSKEMLE